MASFGVILRACVERIAGALVGATIGAVLGAAMDARWAVHAAGPAKYSATLTADLGLIAPVAIAIGLVTALAVLFFHGFDRPTGARWLELARERIPSSLTPLFLAVGAIVWLSAVARFGLRVMQIQISAAAAGTTLALGAGLFAGAIAVAAVGGARACADRWPRTRLDPALAVGIGLVLFALFVTFAISTGTTSGAGHRLAVFGVFKRDELDLRAPALCVLIGAAAYAGTMAVHGRRVIAVLGVLILPVFTVRSAIAGLSERRVALAIERGAPLGRLALGPLRRFGDRDHERYTRGDAKPIVLATPSVQRPIDAQNFIREHLPDRTNVILITVDTLRYDLGYMGYPRAVSPNLDSLVERAVSFDKAYALASYTGKSVGPLLIGKYSIETHRDFTHFTRYPKPERFVQERLSAAGVNTLSLQALWYFAQPGYGYERGFDVLDASAVPRVITSDDRSITGDKLADATIAALQKPDLADKRFYMWVHFLDLHEEYVHHPDFDFGTKDRDLYDSEVAFVDHQIGRILEALAKTPFAARTALIVTSDHGEAFREHGMIRHGFELWEELVRVPLIVWIPGAPAHRVTTVRRSAIDLVATLLDIYGVPQPDSPTDFVDGQSLLSDVFLPPGYTPQPRIVFVDMCEGPNNADRQAFIDGDLKLTAAYGRPLGLYDLATDPGEKKDLLDDPALRDRIVPRYRAFRRTLRDVRIRETP